jgi:hypothetical protein
MRVGSEASRKAINRKAINLRRDEARRLRLLIA